MDLEDTDLYKSCPKLETIADFQTALADSEDAAAQRLYRDWEQAVFWYAFSKCSDTYLAVEISRDTFFRFWESHGNYSHGVAIITVLYTICSNLFRDHLRRRNVVSFCPLEDDHLEFGSTDRAIDKLPDKVVILMCMDRLPKRLRRIVDAYFWIGLTQDEISEKFNISPDKAWRLLNEGKRIMKHHLAELGWPEE